MKEFLSADDIGRQAATEQRR